MKRVLSFRTYLQNTYRPQNDAQWAEMKVTAAVFSSPKNVTEDSFHKEYVDNVVTQSFDVDPAAPPPRAQEHGVLRAMDQVRQVMDLSLERVYEVDV